MKFLLLVCWDAESQNADPEPPAAEVMEESFPWLDELQAQGRWVTGDRLSAPAKARTVRRRGGKVQTTDGPFAETKEAIGGFDLIEADSLDEAAEIASRHPAAAGGSIEVRALWGQG